MSDREQDESFETLLRFLRDSRGFDFTGYKRSTLMRRVSKRMDLVGARTYPEYLDRLQVDPQEFTELFNFILINVTSFFRDEAVWRYVADEIIPRIVDQKSGSDAIRVWDAGCASGEEAYTVAMLLAEALAPEQFASRVKIYATDVDEDALERARHAAYTAKELEGVSEVRRRRFFAASENGTFAFDKELRRSIVFGRHDLVQDAPISRVDLLVCRNTLMYFNADIQAKILANFRFAVNRHGYMVLGKAEMLFTKIRSFVPVDIKRRVFAPADGEADAAPRAPVQGVEPGGDLDEVAQRTAAFEASPIAQLVIAPDHRLTFANAQARRLLRLGRADMGRPLEELEIAHRPIEVRARIEEAHGKRTPLRVPGVEWMTGESEAVRLNVEIVPLLGPEDAHLGTAIVFEDVTGFLRLEEELQTSHQELETAMEELQSTNEELETTNEELQSTNEELETTNEELQSTNEELETMNEELQSTNEELEAVNVEARARAEELSKLNLFLESILGSTGSGVVVVDGRLNVQVWNQRAEDLWGARRDEVEGRQLLGLDIGLPVEQLAKPVRAALGGERHTVELEATTRKGRGIICRVSISPLVRPAGEISGALLLMDEA